MNMQGKNTQNTTAKGRMMDFSPVRKTAGTISGTKNSAIASPSRTRTLTPAYTYSLSERELERKKQAKKERERRE